MHVLARPDNVGYMQQRLVGPDSESYSRAWLTTRSQVKKRKTGDAEESKKARTKKIKSKKQVQQLDNLSTKRLTSESAERGLELLN